MALKRSKKNTKFKFFLKTSVLFVLYTSFFVSLLRDLSFVNKELQLESIKSIRFIHIPLFKGVIISSVAYLIFKIVIQALSLIANLIIKNVEVKFTKIENKKIYYNFNSLNMHNPFLYANKTMGLRE